MSNQDYNANDMQHLSGLAGIQKRPGMYIGTTGSSGLTHLAFEMIDNSVDEAVAGYCDKIIITLYKDGSVEVEDNGRGIPTEIHSKTGLPAVLAVFTLLHFGGKFGGGNYKVGTSGLHGVGSSVVAALSTKTSVTVKRDGEIKRLELQRGKLGKFAGESPDTKFTPQKDNKLQDLGKMKKGERTGTTVRFWPDAMIFIKGSIINTEAIYARARQTAFLVPGLTISVIDETSPDGVVEETFCYTGGVVDMVDHLATDQPICDTIHIKGEGVFTETVPMLNEQGHMESTDVDRTVEVDIALRWGNGYDSKVASFVNVVSTPKEGTHVKGFERALVNTLRKSYDGTRLLKANEDLPNLEDMGEGLTAVVSIGVPEPQFVGQTKEELGTAGVTKVVQDIVNEGLKAWVSGKKKTQVRTVLEKIANASRVRVAHRTQKEAARRKTALEGASMPAKLVDCRAIGVEGSECYLVEGDSALGCINFDTIVKTVGTQGVSFEQLAEDWKNGIEHFGYATDDKGDIVVVPLVEPHVTKKDAELVEVVLDNGEKIKCTPDHPFRLRDGSYVEAQDLTPGDSLMPLYTRRSAQKKNGGKDKLKDYDMVWQNHSEKWTYVHHLSDEYNLGVGFYLESDGSIRHHIDFDKHNNDPRNLKRMDSKSHFLYHKDHREQNLERIEAGYHRWLDEDGGREFLSKSRKQNFERIEAGYRRWLDEEGGREIQSAHLTMQWQNPEFRQMCLERLQERNDDPEWRAFFDQSFQDWYHGLSDEDKIEYAEDMRRKQEKYWSIQAHREEQSERVRQYFVDHPEHRERHREMGSAVWEDEELRAWRSEKTIEQFSDPAERQRQSEAVYAWLEANPEWGEKHSERMVEWWAEHKEEHRKKTARGLQNYVKSVPAEERKRRQIDGRKIAALKRIREFEGFVDMDADTLKATYEQQRLTYHPTALKFVRLLNEMFDGDVERLKDAASNVNHTVVSVTRLTETGDVYDLTVDKYHNFALEAGIFVHNSARQGRNSEFQALLPLRGKILNVQKANMKQILDNAECASIIQVLGAGSGRTFDIEQMRYSRLVLMSVPSDETVLLADADGFLRLREIGPFVDGVLANGDVCPDVSTVALDKNGLSAVSAPLKGVVRHHYDGVLRTLKLQYGRSVRVTDSHSVFTWEDGRVALRTAGELKPGDVVVAPKRIPHVENPVVELDVLKLLVDAGLTKSVFVNGESVEHVGRVRSAENWVASGSMRFGLDRRVKLSKDSWAELVRLRTLAGLTQKDLANRLGYAQPISVCVWETGKSDPPETLFREYLDVVGGSWPDDAVFVPSVMDELRAGHENSKNARYRKTSVSQRLDSMSPEEIASLGREVTFSVHAHHSRPVPRFIPMSEELCEMLGWFAAEGSTTKGRVRFSLGEDDDHYIPALKDIIFKVTGETASVHISKNYESARDIYIDSLVWSYILRALGVGLGAHNKRVPDVLFNVGSALQLAFLRGVYMGDGTKQRKGAIDSLTIDATVSRELANGISYLLTFLGITAGVSSHLTKPATLANGQVIDGNSICYGVTVGGRNQVRQLHSVWAKSPYAHLLYEWLARGGMTNNRAFNISNDLIGLAITDIVDEDISEDVYDLSVADMESFVAGFGGGVMAHNSDADSDGKHINCLIVMLVAKLFKPILENGRLYSAIPPLHKIEVLGRNKEVIYTHSPEEMEQTVAKLKKAGKKIKEPIQRYKGLGEMDAEELWETTMNPVTRSLKKITMDDVEAAEKMLELLMGSDVPARRQYLIDNSKYAKDIDT